MIRDSIRLLVTVGFFIVVVLLIASMWVFGFGFFSTNTANYRGGVQQTEQIQANGSYRIAQYDRFYDQCASIQTLTDQIRITVAEVNSETDPITKRDLVTNLNAQRSGRAAAINQYNADSAKTDTAAHFKASGLPATIDQNQENITCN